MILLPDAQKYPFEQGAIVKAVIMHMRLYVKMTTMLTMCMGENVPCISVLSIFSGQHQHDIYT
jgi:hypothetical protein